MLTIGTAVDGRSVSIEVTVLEAENTGTGTTPSAVKGTGDSATLWGYTIAAVLHQPTVGGLVWTKRRPQRRGDT